MDAAVITGLMIIIMVVLLAGGLLALGLRNRKRRPGAQSGGELSHYLATRNRLRRRLRAKIGDRTQ